MSGFSQRIHNFIHSKSVFHFVTNFHCSTSQRVREEVGKQDDMNDMKLTMIHYFICEHFSLSQ